MPNEVQIGTVASLPVIGQLDDDGTRLDATLTIGDLVIVTDGAHIGVNAGETGREERWPVACLGLLLELHQTGALDQLITLARRWRTA